MLTELIETHQSQMAALFGIPLVKDPSNATSEAEMEIYYAQIERMQQRHFIEPVVRYIASLHRARLVARRRVRRPARFSANGGR